MATHNHLLTRFPFIESNSLYEVRKKQASVWGQASSKVIGGSAYRLVHNRAELPRSCLDYLDCSAGVEGEIRERQNRYWLLLPLSGHCEVAVNHKEFSVDATRAVLQAPWETYRFRATAGCTLTYGLDAALMHKHFPEGWRGHLGYTIEGSYRNVACKLLAGLAEALDDWATGSVGRKEHPGFVKHLEAAVVTCLVEGIRDDMSGGFYGGRIGNMPIAAIRTFMASSLSDDLTVKDIAEAAGVSVRTLQTGFAEHYFTKPMQMLKIMRLDKARDLLKSPKGPGTVGEACKAVGFGHAGRFSKEYAARFCESPSETLDRRTH